MTLDGKTRADQTDPPTCPCPMYATAACPCEYCTFDKKQLEEERARRKQSNAR